MDTPPRAVISAILFKKINKRPVFFTQIRWKPKKSPQYLGVLELPAGGIKSYEDVYDTLSREVKEETNLDIIRIIDNYKGEILSTKENQEAFVFKPFICQQVVKAEGGLPWIGFVFLCEVEGEVIIQENEAKEPKWLTLEELEGILKNKEKIFILQYPVIKYLIEELKKGKIKDL